MKTVLFKNITRVLLAFLFIWAPLTSCKKIKEINYNPEIEPLKQGFKTSAALGYCASLANTFFKGGSLPENVVIHSKQNTSEGGAFILIAEINDNYPLPFNFSIGEITIVGIGDENGGVINVIFTDIDILEAKYEFKGIHTIPVSEIDDGVIMTAFAEQDIVIGEGSDTLLAINMTNPQISMEMKRLEEEQPTDAFVAVKQNVWFVTVNQNNTISDIYDDEYAVYGGGQIAEVSSLSGGILYHAMIGAKFTPSICEMNPTSGVGFIQNLKVGSETDLGHIFLNFHERCDGKAYVELGTGKYLTSNHKNVELSFY